MLGFERAIWISRRPRRINWWSGYYAIFKLSWDFCRKHISFVELVTVMRLRPLKLNWHPGRLYGSFTVLELISIVTVILASVGWLQRKGNGILRLDIAIIHRHHHYHLDGHQAKTNFATNNSTANIFLPLPSHHNFHLLPLLLALALALDCTVTNTTSTTTSFTATTATTTSSRWFNWEVSTATATRTSIKVVGSMSKTTAVHRHHTLPNFMENVNKRRRIFLSLSELGYGS